LWYSVIIGEMPQDYNNYFRLSVRRTVVTQQNNYSESMPRVNKSFRKKVAGVLLC